MGVEETQLAEKKDEKMDHSNKQNRLHVSFPDSIKLKLEEIKSDTDKQSISEVFRQAVMFYSLAYEEHKKGSDILIRDKDGSIERLRMFI